MDRVRSISTFLTRTGVPQANPSQNGTARAQAQDGNGRRLTGTVSSIWPITAASKGLTQEGSAGLGGGGSGGGRALPSARAVGSPVMFGLAAPGPTTWLCVI
eukprot:COSAG01_NODE_2760_length_7120_cov_49.854253_3_plen_102_part_00